MKILPLIFTTLHNLAFCFGKFCFFLVMATSVEAHAHSSERIYPFLEITDEMLSMIEMTA